MQQQAPEPLFRIGELSRRTGVSPSLIRAWERRYGLLDPCRSDGNYRLYTRDDLARLRLMQHYLDQKVAPARAAELVLQAREAAAAEGPGVPEGDVRRALAVLEESLEGFDEGPADRVLDRLLGVFSPGAVLRDVVLRYLAQLGDRWACGDASIAQEHFASTWLEGWMVSLGTQMPQAGRRTAVLACVPGEHHRLGLLAFSLVLRDAGWKVVYLGGDVPISAVEHAAATVRPDAVVLSAALSATLASSCHDLCRVAGELPVVLGGAGAHGELPEPLGSRVLPADPVAAAQVLDRTLNRR